MQARRDVAQCGKHEFGGMLVGDGHVEQAGEGGELGLLAQDAQALLEQIGLQYRAARDVQRIVRRAKTRQGGAQFGDRGVRERGHRHMQHLRAVRGDFARTTGDRYHADPLRLQHAGARDHVGSEQQVLDRLHAHDAVLAAYAVEYAIVADQRAGVRLCGPRGDFRQADLQHNDRFCRSDRASCGRGKTRRMADRLSEQRDRAHVRLVDQMVDEVRAIEVGLVAGRDHVRQADLVLRRQAGDEAAVRAALGDDCDRAGLGGCAKTAGPQRHIVDEIYEAQAVRAEQRYIVLARQ